MKRLTEAIIRITRGLSGAVSRFPLTVVCLSCTTILMCYMIFMDQSPELIIQKLIFTFLLGSFLGIAAQFICERFERLLKRRVVIYGLSTILTGGYYLILLPAPDISMQVGLRTFVAMFAMLCAILWVPSYGDKFDFNSIALIHLKSAFTSVLYSGVLTAGCAAIIAAIDTLLFNINNDTYAYMMTIIWVLFATIYYLSLLPRFNSEDETERKNAEHAGQYPRFLEILVSYIAIPLLTAYTMVLAAYFIKILITLNWPSGQLGAMVLAYSAAGLLIYVLSSQLENRFASLYRMVFPKVLIPVVIMQLISVGIRLNAYGITESRYYIVLFGIFSIVCGVVLNFKPVSKNGIIALLAAGFAIFSVLPPIDAFTVSRVSQISRLENMLITEGILVDGKLSPKTDVPMTLRIESTSILFYLDSRNNIKYIKWLPADFKTRDQMKGTFGFEPSYADDTGKNFYASIDMEQAFNISDYDICVNTDLDSWRMEKSDQPAFDFEVRKLKYQLTFERVSHQEVLVSVKNTDGVELVRTGLYDFVKALSESSDRTKEDIPPEKMTFDIENNGYKLRIILQDVNFTCSNDDNPDINYSVFVMFGAPVSSL